MVKQAVSQFLDFFVLFGDCFFGAPFKSWMCFLFVYLFVCLFGDFLLTFAMGYRSPMKAPF